MRTKLPKQRCPECNYLRIGRLFYCPKCGSKYENEIPVKNHPATYKRCMECRYYTSKRDFYGFCVCPNKNLEIMKGIQLRFKEQDQLVKVLKKYKEKYGQDNQE